MKVCSSSSKLLEVDFRWTLLFSSIASYNTITGSRKAHGTDQYSDSCSWCHVLRGCHYCGNDLQET